MRIFLFVSMLLMILVACSPDATLPTAPAIRTDTASPAETKTPMTTSTHNIITLSTVTPTATAVPRFTRQCLQINDKEVELNEVALGTILFIIAPPGDLAFSRYLKDVQTGNVYKLPFKGYEGWGIISPNKNMLATRKNNVLQVFDAQAKAVAKVSLNRSDLVSTGSMSWLDDERIIIDTEKYGTLLVVNPFTGEQQIISNELPELYPYFKDGLWWPVTYSPNLEWVAYYSARNEKNDYIEGPVVYDVVKKQILWGAGNGVGSDATWSPDGQEVAFTSGMDEYQLYLINRSGQAKAVLSESLPHKAFEPSWSPDGRFIAFWNANRLMIYDRQIDWVFDTCIPGYESGGNAPPDWSPNGQEIIVFGYSTQPLFINWQEKTAYKIKHKQNHEIIGWMNSTP